MTATRTTVPAWTRTLTRDTFAANTHDFGGDWHTFGPEPASPSDERGYTKGFITPMQVDLSDEWVLQPDKQGFYQEPGDDWQEIIAAPKDGHALPYGAPGYTLQDCLRLKIATNLRQRES